MNVNYEVDAPFAIQLEPVEGCSLACSFCGIQAIRDNGADAELGVHGKNSAPYKFMEAETLERIASNARKLGWNPRWEFAMHGEPTMHPDLPGLVRIVRKHHPKGYILLTTNGSGLLKKPNRQIEALFDAGVNTLALDDYKHSGGWVKKILDDIPYELAGYNIYRYPDDPRGNPHHRHNKQMLVIINDISENTDGNHKLTNQGGASFKAEALAQRCAKPFRELSVRWDGNVALCCDDWQGKYKIGNVLEDDLQALWYHPRMEAARRRLYLSDRSFGPCNGCNVRTMRNGLLPDKLGRSEMAAPDEESNAVIKEAMRGKVFSIKLAA